MNFLRRVSVLILLLLFLGLARKEVKGGKMQDTE